MRLETGPGQITRTALAGVSASVFRIGAGVSAVFVPNQILGALRLGGHQGPASTQAVGPVSVVNAGRFYAPPGFSMSLLAVPAAFIHEPPGLWTAPGSHFFLGSAGNNPSGSVTFAGGFGP